MKVMAARFGAGAAAPARRSFCIGKIAYQNFFSKRIEL
jgi:hypothetical protein